jgi:polysaccharide chain length determinant protein (PEP-CTERM system associated)
MEERSSFHPLDYLSVFRRRKWWLITPVLVALVAGAIAVFVLPKEYKSESTIGVAAPTLSPEILKGVSSLDATERQRAISQHLLGNAVLERVVREEQIDPKKPTEEVAAWLRKRITPFVPTPIGVSSRASDRGVDTIVLEVKLSDSAATQKVANRLAYVFVDENSKRNTERAENTVEVLASQLRESQERLTQLEDQLRTKKERYTGRLPDQIDANLSTANGLRSQLESISMQLGTDSQQLLLLETQLQQMKQGSGAAPALSSASAAIQQAQIRINTLNQQLMTAQAAGYTEKHPEIINLKAEIAQAKNELASAKQDGPATTDLLRADPLYNQKVAERDGLKARLASLRVAEGNIRNQIAAYQSRIEAAPMVEQELFGITREHSLENARYTDLKAKYDLALLNGDIARKQGGERFSVMFAASKPVLVSATPAKIMLMALAAGLMLGAALLIGREFVDRSVHDARALQSEFELPVLGEIPTIHGAA